MKKIVTAILILLVIVGAGSSYYFYDKYQKTQYKLDHPEEVAATELDGILTKLRQLIELPDETPQLATVLDKEKLKDQPFFSKAENGDKVLIYSGAKKAILYRDSANKIIELAPLIETSPSPTPKASKSPVPSLESSPTE